MIAEMLGVSAIPWNIHLNTTIAFYSDEQFSHDLLQFIDEQEHQFHRAAIALEDRGLMTAAEVGQSEPKLEIHTNDMREGDTSPMPTISHLPGNVEWLNEPAWK